jgi:Na+-translocating ferredoxin:NAD+ oxidoreductase RNF subunit RnfB
MTESKESNSFNFSEFCGRMLAYCEQHVLRCPTDRLHLRTEVQPTSEMKWFNYTIDMDKVKKKKKSASKYDRPSSQPYRT